MATRKKTNQNQPSQAETVLQESKAQAEASQSDTSLVSQEEAPTESKKLTKTQDSEVEKEAIRLYEESTGTTFTEYPSDTHRYRFTQRAKKSLGYI